MSLTIASIIPPDTVSIIDNLLFSQQLVNGSSVYHPSSVLLHCIMFPDSRWMAHRVALTRHPSSVLLHCIAFPDSRWMAHYVTLTLNCYTLLHYVPRQSVNGSSYRSPVVCHPLYCVVWQSVSQWMLLSHLWIAFTRQHILFPTVGEILTRNFDDLNESILLFYLHLSGDISSLYWYKHSIILFPTVGELNLLFFHGQLIINHVALTCHPSSGSHYSSVLFPRQSGNSYSIVTLTLHYHR